jgi:glycosyltransferase involved in cell wall biosynthesis
VPGGRQPLGEVPVPALGPADGERVEAVVDNADVQEHYPPSPAEADEAAVEVSVVIPCLNEAQTIGDCVRAAYGALADGDLHGEVIVVDNGSDDGSGNLAREAGATVIEELRQGYGSAYQTGLAAARGTYIVMVDADLTYDLREIPKFVAALEGGAQVVIGNRMNGIRPGAMPLLSRIGNPLLSRFLNVLHPTPVGDVHCGMRALRRDVLPVLDLRTTGMEFASEMVIRAARERLDMREIPVELHPRAGESKLSPFRDGWRHLRLILVYNPTFLFLLPGALMLVAGVIVMILVLASATPFGHQLYIHSLIVGSLLVLLGVQAIGFGICARAYSVYFIGERDEWFGRMRSRVRLEHGVVLAVLIAVGGLTLFGIVLGRWAAHGFGRLSEQRLAIVAMTVLAVGAQIFFTSFLLSVIGLRWRRDDVER